LCFAFVGKNVPEQLDQLCPPHTVLATDSSSFRISALETARRWHDKILNMHFYPPVWQIPMVELMGGTVTTEATMTQARRFVRSLGSTPILVCKESTGFVFNRMWRAIKKESLHLVNDGVASYEDVDCAWMLVTKALIGPSITESASNHE
jgi:3-hydroxybutyryl-CoA dehydrogenase